jgi:eukaryotic-like serine/threonine-protein kinase
MNRPDTDEQYGRNLMRRLPDPPDAPTRIDLSRAITVGRRRRRTRRIATVTAAATVTAMMLAAAPAVSNLFDRGPQRVHITDTSPAPQQPPRPVPSAPSTARPFRFAPDADVADPLTRPETIRTNSDGGGSSCRYAGELVVTVTRDHTYECGPVRQTFTGDQRISVDVVLRTAGGCAVVKFLSANVGSYAGAYGVNICAHGYIVNWYEGDSVEQLGTYLLPERTQLREPHRVAIEIHATTAILYRDDREVAVVDLGKGVPLGGGKVWIGGYGDPAGGDPPYEVALRNLEIIG